MDRTFHDTATRWRLYYRRALTPRDGPIGQQGPDPQGILEGVQILVRGQRLNHADGHRQLADGPIIVISYSR